MSLQTESALAELAPEWAQVQRMLRAEFGETAYKTWLTPLAMVARRRRSRGARRPDSIPQRLEWLPTTPTAFERCGAGSTPRLGGSRSSFMRVAPWSLDLR